MRTEGTAVQTNSVPHFRPDSWSRSEWLVPDRDWLRFWPRMNTVFEAGKLVNLRHSAMRNPVITSMRDLLTTSSRPWLLHVCATLAYCISHDCNFRSLLDCRRSCWPSIRATLCHLIGLLMHSFLNEEHGLSFPLGYCESNAEKTPIHNYKRPCVGCQQRINIGKSSDRHVIDIFVSGASLDETSFEFWRYNLRILFGLVLTADWNGSYDRRQRAACFWQD